MLFISLCFVLCGLFLFGGTAFSDTVRISQIDNSRLLLNQSVNVYVSVTDRDGDPIPNLTEDNFTLYEMGEQRRIQSFQRGVNINQGIKLLLVVDNSGSMYWDASGKERNSSNERVWRINYAKEAVSSLLNNIKNPMDRVGLITFNVKVESKIRLTSDKGEVARILQSITRPAEDQAYTELYETLYQSVDELRTYGGRKVIILLSDGQDFPLSDNPHFPKRHGIEKAIRFAQQEGISVFTIGLSARADRENLKRIAEETGGAYFWVFDPAQLRNLYNLIRQQILQEYLISYRATMTPAEKKPVQVAYTAKDERIEAERFYFSGTLFGLGRQSLDWRVFIALPAGCALLWVLSLFKFEQKKELPSLSVRTPAGKRTQVYQLPNTKMKAGITIGTSASSDVTISGDPKIRETQAKITVKDGMYTISSKGPVTVNNRQVTAKVLRSGDLIKLGNTQLVFDAGVVKAEVRKAQKIPNSSERRSAGKGPRGIRPGAGKPRGIRARVKPKGSKRRSQSPGRK
jgi:Ca-activated chloride channel family protein